MKIQTSRFIKLFFPTTLEHDDRQIVITYHGFLTRETHTVEIKDVYNIEQDEWLFFSELIIASRTFIENELAIKGFWKKDAEAFCKEIEAIREQGFDNEEKK
jgi:hypothetical protein